jgi:ribonuclease T2
MIAVNMPVGSYWRSAAIALIIVLLAGMGLASSRRRRKPPADSGGQEFAYYLLTMSYAPDFCAEPGGNKDPRECGKGRHIGFVVHGLWPQGESGRGPENCGTASPVSQDIIRTMLNYIPTESLIQHEWRTHGTCSGLSAADYFAAVRKARDSVTIPGDLKQPTQTLHLSPADIEGKLAASNPSFPAGAFRVSCYRDDELQEIRACFDKNISPRPCTDSAGECRAGAVELLPVR